MIKNEIVYPTFRWFVMFVMIIGAIAQSLVLIAPAPLIGNVAKFLNRDLGLVTFSIMGLWSVMVCIGGIIGGVIADRVGVGKVYLVSSILLILSAALTPLAGTNLLALTTLRLIGGLGTGPVITSISRMAAEWFPSGERGLITGIQGFAVSLGMFIGFGLSPAIFNITQSWPITMVWISIPSVVFIILTIIMMLGPKAQSLAKENQDSAYLNRQNLKLAFADPITYLCVACTFCFSWLLLGINDLTPGYFAIAKPVGVGWGPMAAGKMMMVFQLAYMFGSLFSGILNTNLYNKNTRIQLMLAFLISGFYLFIKFPFIVGNGPNPLLLSVLIVSAFFLGQGVATVMAFISRNYPENITGKVGGISSGLSVLGASVGVGIGSIALSKTHTYQLSILIISGISVLGFLLATRIKKPKVFADSHTNQ